MFNTKMMGNGVTAPQGILVIPHVRSTESSSLDSSMTSPSGPCTIRFITLNDVYELDNFPHYASARKIEAAGATVTFGVLAGDFLAPSLLSSLDKGHGKVDCMNASGIDFVCIGNHEDDVPLVQFFNRIRQSQFVWINSNMQNLPLPADMSPLPEMVVVEADAGSQKRKVCLLGLNTADPALYKPRHFGGSTIEDVNETAVSLYHRIMGCNAGIDAVVPITHQFVTLDRELAALKTGFPVIIGGHDHEVYDEVVEGCHILKVGTEAQNIGIIDLTWEDASQEKPTVTVRVESASKYPRDPLVEDVVRRHNKLTQDLDSAVLCSIPETLLLSSQGIRMKQTTMGTFMTTLARNLLSADCAFMCGGNIRGDRSYVNLKLFTYSHLKGELPFDAKLVCIPLPGYVIANIVQYSRSFALQTPPVIKGCFMQLDDQMVWDRESNTLLAIGGEPLIPDKIYIAAVNMNIIQGVDDIHPLVDYMAQNKGLIDVKQSEDRAIELKNILVGYFSKLALYDMLATFDFDSIDLDHDGFLDMQELEIAAARKYPGQDISALILHNMINLGDKTSSQKISKSEVLAMCISAGDEVKYASTHKDELYDIDEFCSLARHLLGAAYDEAVALETFMRLDTDHSGFVSHRELSESIVERSGLDSLII